jgi:hypothetical protein
MKKIKIKDVQDLIAFLKPTFLLFIKTDKPKDAYREIEKRTNIPMPIITTPIDFLL